MTGEPGRPASESGDESLAWSIVSTLLAGPAVYGFLGWLLDRWLGTSGTCTGIGVFVGFCLSFWIVYLRHGRDDGATTKGKDNGRDPASGDRGSRD